jgi:hypothetical protein
MIRTAMAERTLVLARRFIFETSSSPEIVPVDSCHLGERYNQATV